MSPIYWSDNDECFKRARNTVYIGDVSLLIMLCVAIAVLVNLVSL